MYNYIKMVLAQELVVSFHFLSEEFFFSQKDGNFLGGFGNWGGGEEEREI